MKTVTMQDKPGQFPTTQVNGAPLTQMLLAEAYGLDTAPMEGFEPEAVQREFGLPPEAEVIALLAIGFAQEPDKGYAGRLSLADMVHEEPFGHPWEGKG